MLDYYMFNKLLRNGSIKVERRYIGVSDRTLRVWSDSNGNIYSSIYSKRLNKYIDKPVVMSTSIEHLYRLVNHPQGLCSIIMSSDRHSKRCI